MPPKRGAKRDALHVDVVEMEGDWAALSNAELIIAEAAVAVADVLAGDAQSGAIAVALSNDAHVADLNRRFRDKPNATNVLSFPSLRDGGGQLGDIVMAYETIAREAAEQGVSLKDHVQHLTVHGILHLLGYDHDDDASAERMEALEIKILASLGVANPYTGALEPAKKA